MDAVEQGIWNATAPYGPVAHAWNGEEIMAGDDIWKLGATGDIVPDNTESMAAYLLYRMRVLGGVNKWVANELCEANDGGEFIVSLLIDPIGLVQFFEDLYDGERTVAGEGD